jgi:NADPH:quinone reductase-like Zn-dependent oxidoreductase
MCEQEATILKGQQESEFFSYECVAIVRSIGSKVVGFRPNDRVLALTPGKFDSSFIVNQNSCHKLLPDEIEDIAGLCVPLCSALYALNNFIRPRRREASLTTARCVLKLTSLRAFLFTCLVIIYWLQCSYR